MCAKEISTTKDTTRKKPVMGPDTGKKFTSDYQPTPEAKSRGQLKGKKGQELARAILQTPYNDNAEIKAACAAYLGILPEEVTIEMVMTFKISQKAIANLDVQAYVALSDRAHGKPIVYTEVKADIDLTTQPIVFK